LSDFATADTKYSEQHYIVEGYNLDNYMTGGNEIFTIDETKFAGIKDWVATLNADGRSLILGLMEGVKADATFDTYTTMMTDKALLLNEKGVAIQNVLKETFVAYPDWF
jgi:alpha-glucosidase (family GH31 glycosyl hydrolase)